MRREQGLAPHLIREVLRYRPGQSDSVGGRGGPAQLVNEDEAAGRRMMEDVGGLLGDNIS